jgi:hypothetical protein
MENGIISLEINKCFKPFEFGASTFSSSQNIP